MTTSPTQGEHARCQACIDRNDGFYGSYAPECPVHKDDGTLRSIPKEAAQQASPVAQADLITIRTPSTRQEAAWLLKLARLLVGDLNSKLDELLTPAVVSTNGAESNMTGGAVPDFVMGRGYIEGSIGGYAYRQGWDDALAALRASHGQAPAGAMTLQKLADSQEPLGAEFEKVLYDNLPDLYATAQAAPADRDEGISREQWINRAVRAYLIAGDTEDQALECAKVLCREQNWDPLQDDLADPYDAAMSDIEGRGPAPAAGAVAGPVAPAVPIPLADAQHLLSWMDGQFGNDDGDDWFDADAASVADGLDSAVQRFLRAHPPTPAAQADSGVQEDAADADCRRRVVDRLDDTSIDVAAMFRTLAAARRAALAAKGEKP